MAHSNKPVPRPSELGLKMDVATEDAEETEGGLVLFQRFVVLAPDQQHVAGRQRSMAAQAYLATRRKPPQVIVIARGHKKGGLRKIIFSSDLTQALVI